MEFVIQRLENKSRSLSLQNFFVSYRTWRFGMYQWTCFLFRESRTAFDHRSTASSHSPIAPLRNVTNYHTIFQAGLLHVFF